MIKKKRKKQVLTNDERRKQKGISFSKWFEGRKHNLDETKIKVKQTRDFRIDDSVESHSCIHGTRYAVCERTIVS